MSEKEEEKFQSSNTCWICKKPIDHGDEKVRDHCHVTGKFRDTAHWSCNINPQLTKNVPVIFHNSRGYNSHLNFRELHKFSVSIDVIPNGLEKCMALFLNKSLVFINSMQFTSSSLDKLDKNLSDNDFKYLIKEFSSKNLELLKQNGVYPYEYMDSFKTFIEKNCLLKKYFYRSLNNGTTDHNGKTLDTHISHEEYLTCEKIWDIFDMKNIGDYHDHYLKKDVLLLANVFEKVIDTCLRFYELDPCHYFSSPGLSWDTILKMTRVKLEKISDFDKYLFTEKGLNGGISYIAKKIC